MTFSLAGAQVRLDSGGVLLSYDCDGEPPSAGTVIWSTTFYGKAGPIRQVGWKTLDGHLIAFFAFDHVRAQQTNLAGVPRRTDRLWSAHFPLSAIEGIEEGDRWRAVVATEGAVSEQGIEGIVVRQDGGRA